MQPHAYPPAAQAAPPQNSQAGGTAAEVGPAAHCPWVLPLAAQRESANRQWPQRGSRSRPQKCHSRSTSTPSPPPGGRQPWAFKNGFLLGPVFPGLGEPKNRPRKTDPETRSVFPKTCRFQTLSGWLRTTPRVRNEGAVRYAAMESRNSTPGTIDFRSFTWTSTVQTAGIEESCPSGAELPVGARMIRIK